MNIGTFREFTPWYFQAVPSEILRGQLQTLQSNLIAKMYRQTGSLWEDSINGSFLNFDVFNPALG